MNVQHSIVKTPDLPEKQCPCCPRMFKPITAGQACCRFCVRIYSYDTEALDWDDHYYPQSRHVLYRTWRGMIDRCYDYENQSYPNYGGRGVLVCDRWLQSFKNFVKDMKLKPFPDYSIERIFNFIGYHPKNCMWASHAVQNDNKTNSLSWIRTCNELGIDRRMCIMLTDEQWVAYPKRLDNPVPAVR